MDKKQLKVAEKARKQLIQRSVEPRQNFASTSLSSYSSQPAKATVEYWKVKSWSSRRQSQQDKTT